MGRPRKRELAVERVAGALNIQLGDDVVTLKDLEEIAGLPDLESRPKRTQMILAAFAMGFDGGEIAESLGITRQRVWAIKKECDPEGMLTPSPKAVKALISKRSLSVAMAILGSIDMKDIKAASLAEKTRAANQIVDIEAKLNQTKHKEIGSSKLDHLVAGMIEECGEGNVEDGEIIEMGGGFENGQG